MGQRHDLQLAASALSLDDSHKKKLQRVADDALEVAEGSAAATVGTALHGHTETIDRGLPLGFVPPPFDADIEAYKRCTDGIEWLSVECFRVKDDWQVAGTADRIGRDRHGRVRVYDVKTGQTAIDYPHSMAAQLALYSRCQPYDIATDTRQPVEDGLDLNTGIIIWLPAGKAHCELFEIDLGRGWGACNLAKQVWDWRAQKGLCEPLRDMIAPPTWESLIRDQVTIPALRCCGHAYKSKTNSPRPCGACSPNVHNKSRPNPGRGAVVTLSGDYDPHTHARATDPDTSREAAERTDLA